MTEWNLNRRGAIDRSCSLNARKAINTLPDGYARLSILTRHKTTMRFIADEVERHHRYRPTLKATWDAVNAIRDIVFRAAMSTSWHSLDGDGVWICQNPDCQRPLRDGKRRLFFIRQGDFNGSFLCRECAPLEQFNRGPLTLHSVRHEMILRGMV